MTASCKRAMGWSLGAPCLCDSMSIFPNWCFYFHHIGSGCWWAGTVVKRWLSGLNASFAAGYGWVSLKLLWGKSWLHGAFRWSTCSSQSQQTSVVHRWSWIMAIPPLHVPSFLIHVHAPLADNTYFWWLNWHFLAMLQSCQHKFHMTYILFHAAGIYPGCLQQKPLHACGTQLGCWPGHRALPGTRCAQRTGRRQSSNCPLPKYAHISVSLLETLAPCKSGSNERSSKYQYTATIHHPTTTMKKPMDVGDMESWMNICQRASWTLHSSGWQQSKNKEGMWNSDSW